MKTVFPSKEEQLSFNEWAAYIKGEVMKNYSRIENNNTPNIHSVKAKAE